jgi:hypothetical protein
MSFSNKIESDNDMLTKTSRMYDEKAAEVNYLNEALTSAVHDPNSVGQEQKIMDYSNKLKIATKQFEELNKYLMDIQVKTTKDIQHTADSIKNYQQTLKNNNNLFQKYSHDIQNKMQLVATRDRMLQLSQERNLYKKKIIYVLFSIIIALLICVVAVYTFFGKNKV